MVQTLALFGIVGMFPIWLLVYWSTALDTIGTVSAYSIQYKQCDYKPYRIGGNMLNIDLKGCHKELSTETLCTIRRGQELKIKMTFVPYKSYRSLVSELMLKLPFFSINVPGVDRDACQRYTRCPLSANTENHLSATSVIPKELQDMRNAKVMAKLTDPDSDLIVGCGIVTISII